MASTRDVIISSCATTTKPSFLSLWCNRKAPAAPPVYIASAANQVSVSKWLMGCRWTQWLRGRFDTFFFLESGSSFMFYPHLWREINMNFSWPHCLISSLKMIFGTRSSNTWPLDGAQPTTIKVHMFGKPETPFHAFALVSVRSVH